mmetsp:Transcript_4597/g.10793  ORF Transcript_4597/g.10793 Transcript_4597/m.10793 type:complete len:828 (-) Transcript_4597:38-2521(-)
MPLTSNTGNILRNSGDPDDEDGLLAEMKAMLSKQRHVIDKLKQEVAELKGEAPPDALEEETNDVPNAVVTVEEVDETSPQTKGTGRKTIVEQLEENPKVHTAFYEFDQSMWDAALLLCFHHTSFTDKFLLLIGVVLNLTVQFLLLMIVLEDMLENPFGDDTVAEMVKYRVTTGHKIFDADQGKSRIARLCNRELWSFEQEQYNEMYDYLYKPIPGILLSTLAIILWTLTIMVEYRRCLEQGLGVYNLPSLTVDDEFEAVDEEGTIEIMGIRPCMRWIALIVLCGPRFVVMGFLAYVGCQYLAQTPSLSDIVLNAVALAFVLDVDELVANVLLTEKLRGLLTKISPLSCGTTRSAFAPVLDLFRYALTVGVIVGACIVWLVPFQANVEAAAMALCGGYQDFSFDGGIATEPSIVLKPRDFGTDLWATECADTTYESYVFKYYGLGEKNQTRQTANTSATVKRSPDYWVTKQLESVMGFALAAHPARSDYNPCPLGEIYGPQPEVGERQCIPLPDALKRNLPGAVEAGSTSLPQDCPRFNTNTGCSNPAIPDACVWTWLSQKCDTSIDSQAPPGLIYYDACSSDFQTKCFTWEWFGVPHPNYNCLAADLCNEDTNFECLVMRGVMDVHVSDIDGVRDNLQLFMGGLKAGLMNVTGVTDENNVILKDVDDEYGTQYRRLAATSPTPGDIIVDYSISNFAYTVFPSVVLTMNATIVDIANAKFQNNSNSSSGANDSNSSEAASSLFTIVGMDFVNDSVITLDEFQGTGDGDGDDGGDSPFGYGGPGYGGPGDDGGDDGDDGDGGDDFGGDDGADGGEDPDGGDGDADDGEE